MQHVGFWCCAGVLAVGGLIILVTVPQGIDQLGSGALGILGLVLTAFHLGIAVLLVGALLARQQAEARRARFLEIDQGGVRWFDSARHEVAWGEIAEVERHPLGLGLRLFDGRQLVIGVPDPKEDQGRASQQAEWVLREQLQGARQRSIGPELR